MIRAVVLSALLGAALGLAGPGRAQSVQTQAPCSPVVENSRGAVTVTYSGGCTSGIGPDELKEIVDSALAKRAIPPELLDRFEALGQRFGVTDAALGNFFRLLGEETVAAPGLDAKLREIAERHLTLLRQAGATPVDIAVVAALKRRATAEISTGHYAAAESLLRQAIEVDLAEMHSAQKALDQRRLAAANTKAAIGQLKFTQFQYTAAAETFKEAADLVPPGYDDERLAYLDREALALFSQGFDRDDDDALRGAVERYRALIVSRDRERVPLDWAATQNNLGIALESLGASKEAIAAYREALKERTREREPRDWALTQSNIGNALLSIGNSERGTGRLEEAVTAYREALKELTSVSAPLDRAMTQINLGAGLQAIGERKSDRGRIEEALTVYREVLKELTRDRQPILWATAQNNLGNALGWLGERENGTARLEEAVIAFGEALKERPRERLPSAWASTQNNLANALSLLGERESGTGRLEEAVVTYRDALKDISRKHAIWASMQNNLGNALQMLGEREGGNARLEEAVIAFGEALKETPRESAPYDWAMSQSDLGAALLAIGEHENGTARLEEAVIAFGEALKERPRERVPVLWATSTGKKGIALMLLAERTADIKMAETAVAQIEVAHQLVQVAGHAPLATYFETQLLRARSVAQQMQRR